MRPEALTHWISHPFATGKRAAADEKRERQADNDTGNDDDKDGDERSPHGGVGVLVDLEHRLMAQSGC